MNTLQQRTGKCFSACTVVIQNVSLYGAGEHTHRLIYQPLSDVNLIEGLIICHIQTLFF